MNLQERKDLLVRAGHYMMANDEAWQHAKRRAQEQNAWFIQEFVDLAVKNICTRFFHQEALQELIDNYGLTDNEAPKKVGIVMAGNIPLVGFHDLLCTFVTGHYAFVKPSSKDEVLVSFLMERMKEWNPAAAPYFTVAEMLKGCDAYIATGSNNTSHYFDHYFGKYPHIIRKNRTSVAVLTGEETDEELNALADDVYLFFGLGCRNVTKLFIPRNYNFERLLGVFKKYNHLAVHQKYKNNYDYNLAIHLLNHTYYMSNESILLIENKSSFSPISQLHYEYYDSLETVKQSLHTDALQCIVGRNDVPFGKAQAPGLCDFADGVDTIRFLKDLS